MNSNKPFFSPSNGRENATCYCAQPCDPSSSTEASLGCVSSGNLRGKIPERHLNQVTGPTRPASFSFGAASTKSLQWTSRVLVSQPPSPSTVGSLPFYRWNLSRPSSDQPRQRFQSILFTMDGVRGEDFEQECGYYATKSCSSCGCCC